MSRPDVERIRQRDEAGTGLPPWAPETQSAKDRHDLLAYITDLEAELRQEVQINVNTLADYQRLLAENRALYRALSHVPALADGIYEKTMQFPEQQQILRDVSDAISGVALTATEVERVKGLEAERYRLRTEPCLECGKTRASLQGLEEGEK